jgi:acyl dehydratase
VTHNAAQIDDETLASARSMVGVWLRRDVHWPANAEPLSAHDIRRWSMYSVGDDNPLFCDGDYGQRSVWGTTIAPPTLLYTIDSTIVAPGLPGIQWIYGGTRWEFHRLVRPGDRITARARVIAVKEKSGKHVPRFLVQTGEVLYLDQDDRLVARAEADVLRVPRRRTGQGIRGFEERESAGRHRYSAEDIEVVRKACLTEERRGSEPRYWEDVNVGDQLPPLIKGPLTLVDIVAFYVGRRTTYRPLALAFREREDHPRNVYVSPATGIPMHPAAGHFDAEIAHEIGMADAYDQGWMRANWAAHLVTNWAGDWSMMCAFSMKLLVPNMVGDLTWVRGEVTARRQEGHAHLVELRVHGENQRGERNLASTATVRLPSRDPQDRFLLDEIGGR